MNMHYVSVVLMLPLLIFCVMVLARVIWLASP